MQARMLGIGNQFNEKLVELVGKHKILYDSTTEGYSNFPLQDEIWRKIAGELNEDVSACKLKWKNIRSCYTRYLRQISSQNGKTSRTYYLAKYLTFLLPFCKPRGHSNDVYLSDDNTFLNYEDQDLEIGKIEPIDEDEISTKQESSSGVDEDSTQTNDEHEESNNKRKRWETSSDYESKKIRICESNDESDLNFFKSLLPDVRKMDGKQKNKLKIAILNAVDSILYKDNS